MLHITELSFSIKSKISLLYPKLLISSCSVIVTLSTVGIYIVRMILVKIIFEKQHELLCDNDSEKLMQVLGTDLVYLCFEVDESEQPTNQKPLE